MQSHNLISNNFTWSILKSQVQTGDIKIPQFQREFVWSVEASAKLLDSIVKNYPIGTFIFWESSETLRAVRNVGNLEFAQKPEGASIKYVLDGQQRLTSLVAGLTGQKITRANGKIDDFSNIYVNLTAKDDEAIIITDVSQLEDLQYISLMDAMETKFSVLKKYPEQLMDEIQQIKEKITNYQFPVVSLMGAKIDIATEVFTRINTSGKSLTVFDIMVAKTYDEVQGFDLSEKYRALIDELKVVGYDTMPNTVILHLIALLLNENQECDKGAILNLDKQKFIDIFEDAINAIKSAIDYFKLQYGISVSRILPYHILIVPFAYFFYYHKEKPTGDMAKHLENLFWRCALSERYSASTESKLSQDIKKVDLILKGQAPTYDWTVDTSPEYIIKNGTFATGKSYIKAILCLYASFKPKSFNTNSDVNLSNDALKQSNSRNYHHFFPKSYLKKLSKYDDDFINHILNITMIDDELNKVKIRDKKPSEYMAICQVQNDKLIETMKTHLIDDLQTFGIWQDDYDEFIKQRAKQVSQEIKKRLIEEK